MSENKYIIVDDATVKSNLNMSEAIDAMHECFELLAQEKLTAPPRSFIQGANGKLVLTAGELSGEIGKIGFRLYETISSGSTEQDQIVVVYDHLTGQLDGLIIGSHLGRLRTAAIGGFAVDQLSRKDAKVLSVIGAGYQAETQILAACAVRPFEKIFLHSRTQSKAIAFIERMKKLHGLTIEWMDSKKELVQIADVLLCTTNSREPVIESSWIQPGTHVSSIGPKAKGESEMPEDLAAKSDLLFTDSLAQVKGYPYPYFLNDKEIKRLKGLESLFSDPKNGRDNPEQISLFCSVGLAGTEVMLGHKLLEKLKN